MKAHHLQQGEMKFNIFNLLPPTSQQIHAGAAGGEGITYEHREELRRDSCLLSFGTSLVFAIPKRRDRLWDEGQKVVLRRPSSALHLQNHWIRERNNLLAQPNAVWTCELKIPRELNLKVSILDGKKKKKQWIWIKNYRELWKRLFQKHPEAHFIWVWSKTPIKDSDAALPAFSKRTLTSSSECSCKGSKLARVWWCEDMVVCQSCIFSNAWKNPAF